MLHAEAALGSCNLASMEYIYFYISTEVTEVRTSKMF